MVKNKTRSFVALARVVAWREPPRRVLKQEIIIGSFIVSSPACFTIYS